MHYLYDYKIHQLNTWVMATQLQVYQWERIRYRVRGNIRHLKAIIWASRVAIQELLV